MTRFPRHFQIKSSTPPNSGILLQSLLPLAGCKLNVEPITNNSFSNLLFTPQPSSSLVFASETIFEPLCCCSFRKLELSLQICSLASFCIMLVPSLAIAAFAAATTFATPLKPLQNKKIEAGIQDRSLPHPIGRDVNDAQLPTVRFSP